MVRQEQASKFYEGQLEARIGNDSVAHQKLNNHCSYLERKIFSLEYMKSQVETSYRVAMDHCQAIANDLSTERQKVHNLESRLSELHPTLDRVLYHLSQTPVQQANSNVQDGLQQENQRLREVIAYLQASLTAREEMVKDLQTTLSETFFGFSDNAVPHDYNQTACQTDNSYSDDSSSVDIVTVKPEAVDSDMA